MQPSVEPSWSDLKTKAGTYRKRLPLACTSCRKKKTKCSGHFPSCSNCIKAGIECVYQQSSKQGLITELPGKSPSIQSSTSSSTLSSNSASAPSTSSSSSTSSTSNSSASLRRASRSSDTSSSSSSSSRSRRNTHNNTSRFGRRLSDIQCYLSNNVNSLKISTKSPQLSKQDDPPKFNDLIPQPGGVNFAIANLPTPPLQQFQQSSNTLPDIPIVESLVNLYFQYIDGQPYVFLIHDEFYKNFEENKIPLILLHVLCCLGRRFSKHPYFNQNPKFTSNFFAQQTRELLVYDKPDIVNLTALGLLAIHENGECNNERAWMYSSMACRMAIALEFNKRPKLPQTSFIRREIQVRGIWSCYMSDTFTSQICGRPSFLNESIIEVQLPFSEKALTHDLKYDAVTELFDKSVSIMDDDMLHSYHFQRQSQFFHQRLQSGNNLTGNNSTARSDIEGDTETSRANSDSPKSFSKPWTSKPAISQQSHARQYLGCTAFLIRLCKIQRMATNFLYNSKLLSDRYPFWHPKSTFNKILNLLESFISDIPTKYKYSTQNLRAIQAEGLEKGYVFLHVLYYHISQFMTRFALQLPGFPPRDPEVQNTFQNAPQYLINSFLEKCITSAESVVTIFEDADKCGCPNYSFNSGIALYTSCEIQLAFHASKETSEPLHRRRFLHQGVEYLARLTEFWPMFDYFLCCLKKSYQDYSSRGQIHELVRIEAFEEPSENKSTSSFKIKNWLGLQTNSKEQLESKDETEMQIDSSYLKDESSLVVDTDLRSEASKNTSGPSQDLSVAVSSPKILNSPHLGAFVRRMDDLLAKSANPTFGDFGTPGILYGLNSLDKSANHFSYSSMNIEAADAKKYRGPFQIQPESDLSPESSCVIADSPENGEMEELDSSKPSKEDNNIENLSDVRMVSASKPEPAIADPVEAYAQDKIVQDELIRAPSNLTSFESLSSRSFPVHLRHRSCPFPDSSDSNAYDCGSNIAGVSENILDDPENNSAPPSALVHSMENWIPIKVPDNSATDGLNQNAFYSNGNSVEEGGGTIHDISPLLPGFVGNQDYVSLTTMMYPQISVPLSSTQPDMMFLSDANMYYLPSRVDSRMELDDRLMGTAPVNTQPASNLLNSSLQFQSVELSPDAGDVNYQEVLMGGNQNS